MHAYDNTELEQLRDEIVKWFAETRDRYNPNYIDFAEKAGVLAQITQHSHYSRFRTNCEIFVNCSMNA